MAQRPTGLPHPLSSTRETYMPPHPTFARRPDYHSPRSPSRGISRPVLSPSTSIGFPSSGAQARMDAQYGAARTQQNIPPLGSVTTFGTLQYNDGHSSVITPDISGSIDKGFFLAENEWTCYRRNYFSCTCSFTLNPYYPNVPITFQTPNSQTAYNVLGFGMCISAVVADTDGHKIELVQHTPKRDKGPITTPETVRMAPKVAQPGNHHAGLGMFGTHADPTNTSLATRNIYDSPYGQPPPSTGPQTEHAFERIQFKQATANNGKRRAAQQYYHLLVELWCDAGTQDRPRWVKIAQRKSAKMIVRGRSPGHYQSERRSSTSSGPGGSGSALGGYSGGVVPDFGSGSSMLGSGYGGYDPRPGTSYNGLGSRHHTAGIEVPAEVDIQHEEAKNMEAQRGLRMYPAGAYEGSTDSNGRVEQYPSMSRTEHDSSASISSAASASGIALPQVSAGFDHTGSRVKNEYDGPLPSFCFSGQGYTSSRCGPYESKNTSTSYYPTMISAPGLNMT